MAEQKFYVDINLNGNEIKQVLVERLATAPSPLGIGHTYFDTTTNALTTWDGTSWITAGSNLGYTAEDQANKTDTIAGNTGSSVKFLSAKGVYDWVTGLAYQTVAGLSSAVLSILSSNASIARTNLGLGDSATKNVGTSAGTVAAGNASMSRKYFAYDNTDYSYTGTTAATILRTIPIPAGSVGANSVVELFAQLFKTGTAGGVNCYFYLTTNPTSLTGGSRILYNLQAASAQSWGMWQRLVCKNNIALQDVNNNNVSQASWLNTATSTKSAINADFSVDQYIHIYAGLGNTGDIVGISNYQLYIDNPG